MSDREGSRSPDGNVMTEHSPYASFEESPGNHKVKSYSSPSRGRKVYRDGDREKDGRREERDEKRHRTTIAGTRDNPKSSRCLGVFGLSVYTTKEELYHVMSKYGPVERVQVVIDAKTERSRGFSFVYFEKNDDAKVAKEQCTGMKLNGNSIRVNYSITERTHTPTPGIYMEKPTNKYSERCDRCEERDDYYRGSRYSHRRSPSPYYSSSRKRRYSSSRSYSPHDIRSVVMIEEPTNIFDDIRCVVVADQAS